MSRFAAFLLLLGFFNNNPLPVFSLPTTIPTPLPTPSVTTRSDDCRVDKCFNCNPPPEVSVYICQNINWGPPCMVLWLRPDLNFEYYTLEAGRGSNDFIWPEDESSAVSSVGPAPGITITLISDWGQYTSALEFPGTPDVGDFWRNNIDYFIVSWNPSAGGQWPEIVQHPRLPTEWLPHQAEVGPVQRNNVTEILNSGELETLGRSTASHHGPRSCKISDDIDDGHRMPK